MDLNTLTGQKDLDGSMGNGDTFPLDESFTYDFLARQQYFNLKSTTSGRQLLLPTSPFKNHLIHMFTDSMSSLKALDNFLYILNFAQGYNLEALNWLKSQHSITLHWIRG